MKHKLALLAFLLASPVYGECVNVNSASLEQLSYLPRTGPALAEKILSGRPYADEAALDAVKGIGPTWFEGAKNLLCFEGPTTLAGPVASPGKADYRRALVDLLATDCADADLACWQAAEKEADRLASRAIALRGTDRREQ